MAVHGYTKNYKLIKPQFDTDTWHDYEYDNLDTIDAVLSAIFASGDWKGFWKTNTHYSVGGVVIDQATDTMYKIMVEHTSSAATFSEEQTAHPDYYELWSPNNLAESWAIKTDDKVSNTDYSAKAYAISSGLIDEGSAKEWAIGSGAIGNTGEHSAKKYATDAHNDYISMTTNANVAAVGSNINNVNAVGQSISSVNTVASNISDVNTAVLNIEAIKDAPNQANAASQSASDASQSATNAANSATASANSATDSANSATASATSAQAAQDALNDVQGLIATPIGTIFQSVYVDESLDIARRLNGQLISSTKFTGFRSWLNTVQTANPNLFTTETNWQAEKTNSKLGQCGKFVVDDTAGTIRLPCVVNAQGLVDLALIGGIKSESLPNIVSGSNTRIATNSAPYPTPTGASAIGVNTTDMYVVPDGVNSVGTYESLTVNALNASISSSTYQDGAPVQQEAVQYPYYIQVATGVEETLPAIREYNINTPFFFGQSIYSDVAPDNASWLVSNGQYNAKTVYPDYYDWLVEQMNNGVSGFVASTATYTDYDFVINTANQTFRLPLLNGEEDLPGSTFTNLTLNDTTGTNNYNFTVTKNCFIVLRSLKMRASDSSGTMIRLQTPTHMDYCTSVPTKEITAGVSIFAKKGESVNVGTFGNWGTLEVFRQYDAVGNGSLYYYVGDTVQDASLINAGAVLGQLSNKADIDLSNVNNTGNVAASNLNSKGIRTVVETYVNGTSWYRLFSDGFIEQGGSQTFPFGTTTLTLLVPINVLNANGIRSTMNHTTTESNPMIGILEEGAKIQINTGSGASEYFFWKVEGFKK